jgi:hypothetical protein
MKASAPAPSTMLRMVPLPHFAGEELAPPLLILPRLRGTGTAEGGGGGRVSAVREDHP